MKPWLQDICDRVKVLSPADNQASDAAYEEAYSATMKLGCFDETPEIVLELIACLIERCEALEADIANLRTPNFYWDERNLETAADSIYSAVECDDVSDIVVLRPIHELPPVWVLVTEDEPQVFVNADAAEKARAT